MGVGVATLAVEPETASPGGRVELGTLADVPIEDRPNWREYPEVMELPTRNKNSARTRPGANQFVGIEASERRGGKGPSARLAIAGSLKQAAVSRRNLLAEK